VIAVAGALVMAAAGAGVMWLLRPPAAGASLARPSLDVGPADQLSAGGVSTLWLPTPGGSRTRLRGRRTGRRWSSSAAGAEYSSSTCGGSTPPRRRALANTEGAQAPAVSPDGQWVAFWARRAIWKVQLGGGPAMMIAPDVNWPPRGQAWDARGRLYFAREAEGVIWQVPRTGGAFSCGDRR